MNNEHFKPTFRAVGLFDVVVHLSLDDAQGGSLFAWCPKLLKVVVLGVEGVGMWVFVVSID